ncbi:pentapeptide repeat-containing protein [Rubrobacter indicoceani]|uniref:pentapeptide repeat-containing protein n=1 Tax=Rubrobacter indicoceani TaxID=2051957 RepID=UPI0013C4C806
MLRADLRCLRGQRNRDRRRARHRATGDGASGAGTDSQPAGRLHPERLRYREHRARTRSNIPAEPRSCGAGRAAVRPAASDAGKPPDAGDARTGTELHGTELHGTELHGTELHGTELHGTELHGTELHGTELHGTELHGTELHGTELHGTELHGTELHGTELHGTELHGRGPRLGIFGGERGRRGIVAVRERGEPGSGPAEPEVSQEAHPVRNSPTCRPGGSGRLFLEDPETFPVSGSRFPALRPRPGGGIEKRSVACRLVFIAGDGFFIIGSCHPKTTRQSL